VGNPPLEESDLAVPGAFWEETQNCQISASGSVGLAIKPSIKHTHQEKIFQCFINLLYIIRLVTINYTTDREEIEVHFVEVVMGNGDNDDDSEKESHALYLH